MDERKNAVYPRSIALVHRSRHAQGDGGEEREGEGVVVDHVDANLGEIGEFAGVEGFGTAQAVEE